MKHRALDATLRPSAAALAVCLSLGLSACGGGGGGSNVRSNPPPPPPPPPPVVDTTPMVVNTALVVASGQSIARPIVLEDGASLDNQGAIGGSAVDIGVEAKAPSNIDNHGSGTIRGGTAIVMAHGGELHNGVGSTIEATGTGGECGASVRCAVYSGANDEVPDWEPGFTLVNEGTIIGNVELGSTEFNWVRLVAGSLIQGDLDLGEEFGALELDGAAGTVQEYSAAVTGSTTFTGNLLKSGEGTWIIDTDMSGVGVNIDDGTLQVGNGGTAGSIAGARISNGRLVFNRSDDFVVGGAILAAVQDEGDTATLVQAGTGILTLTHETLIRPDFIVIERGTLQIHNTGGTPGDTEPLPLMAPITNDGSLVFNSRSTIQQWGAVTGSGSVTQNGSGALFLGATNAYTGGTTINSGQLVAPEGLPGNVTVNLDGTLGGATPWESFGAPSSGGDLSNSGTVILRAGNTVVGGDYSQSSTGTLAVSLGSKLDVAGAATLGGGTLEVNGADAGYVANTHTEVLTAAGGVNGTFDQLVKGPGVVFTSSTINYDANSVWLDTTGLDITVAAAGGGIGYTPASMNSAVRVQGAFEQLNDRIATDTLAGVSGDFLQSAGQFQRASSIEAAQASLRSLSGQLHAASAAMTFKAIDAGNQALSDHLDGLRDGHAGFGMWTQQLGGSGGMTRSGFDGIGFQFDGWLVGNDYRIGRSGVAGFAFGQGAGSQQLQHGVDRDHGRRTEGMLYAGLADDRWYMQGRLGFGHFSQDVDRRLLLGDAAEGVWTRYDGRYQVAYGESGLRFGRGDVRIAPFLSLEYARSDRDAFAEQGAGGFGLRSDAQALDRWQAGVGVRAARHWSMAGGRALDLKARAQWRRTLASRGEVFDASFVGLQQWEPLEGIGPSRYSGLFGVGLDATLSAHAVLDFSYDYEMGQHDNAQMLSARLNLAF